MTYFILGLIVAVILCIIALIISINYIKTLKAKYTELESEYNAMKDNYNNVKVLLEKEKQYEKLKESVQTDNVDTLADSSASILSELATKGNRKDKS